jgi:predicted Rossmann fold flavoprotein
VFDATATVAWFEKRGVQLKTEADGRMFPSTNTSATIMDCLFQAARKLHIGIRTSCGVNALMRSEQGRWQLHLLTDEVIEADRVLVATGGFPKIDGYDWLPEQSEPLLAPVPSLFTFNVPESPFLSLAGVAVPDAKVSITGTKQEQRGPVLMTHWGFSGPAVLRLSAWAARDLANVDYRFTLRINWTPTLNESELRNTLQDFRQQNGRKQVVSQNPFGLPSRLWQALSSESGIVETQRWADLPAKNLNRLSERLTNSQFQVVGKSTFKDEFVTCGGVSFGSLHPQTLESKDHPGLFFAGEVLDIDGITGGFNFQSAWTTGYVAGLAIGL